MVQHGSLWESGEASCSSPTLRPPTQETLTPNRVVAMSSSYADNHFAIRLVGFHRLMGLANILKSEDPSRLGFVNAGRCFIYDRLKWNIGDGKIRSAEHKAAKKSEMNSARHLE